MESIEKAVTYLVDMSNLPVTYAFSRPIWWLQLEMIPALYWKHWSIQSTFEPV